MKKTKVLSLVLALCMVFSMAGCMVSDNGGSKEGAKASESSKEGGQASVSAAGTEDDGPFAAYADTITMHFGRDLDPNSADNTALAEMGEPYDNNRWIKLIKEKLNIDVVYDLAAPGDQYKQQIKLGMTSGDLPDYFQVMDFSDYQQMAQSGILADMTALYEQYASPLLRAIIEKEGQDAYLPVTFDGKMFGLPSKMPSTNGYSFLWIRQDWLDKLGLARPTTTQEFLEVARAFKTQDPDGNGQDDTLGTRFDNQFLWSARSIFWGFGAYPDFWTEKDGKVELGTVQPEMKEALAYIKTMYDEQLIDVEFATKDFGKAQEDIVAGKVGMFHGFHWEAGVLKQNMESDPDANWVAIPLPTKDGSAMKIPLTNAVESVLVAASEAEHPEALIKIMNLYVEALFGETGDFSKYFNVSGAGAIWSKAPVFLLDPELDLQGHRDWAKAAETDDYANLGGSGKGFYDFAQEGMLEYQLMFGPGETAFAYVDQTYPNDIVWNAYFGAPMPTQVERGASMSEYLETTMVSLITGQLDMDTGFEEMVSKWKSMGGDMVTDEVNETLAKN